MPTPSEYAEAMELAKKAIADFAPLTGDGVDAISRNHYQRIVAHYTLALRCLRVVAAMEAGELVLRNDDGTWCGWVRGRAVCYAYDPLTAAERAMGVGT